ncbi:hypothetical protein HAHE_15310 [Haloferula helveola]|uniref:Uncharacterized protein n=1 Tax=Haloferula helveola TaxID=490095 RepID=A0ABM7RCX7_9BACT|nr:hypothetical protein HAHE_15310 [Haloferula helveola]
MSAKTTCPECGAEFLKKTADSNGGYCLRCRPKKKREVDHESLADTMEIGLRLLLGFVFGCIFAGAGYGVGAMIWVGVGVLMALAGFPLGFLYGFFLPEINGFIRNCFRMFLGGGD